MILHTLNQAPANTACFQSALSAMDEQDSLLLIEDGVYWALPAYSDQLASIPGRVFALEADIRSRGVGNSTLECIDDSGFVQLCVSHHKVVSWF